MDKFIKIPQKVEYETKQAKNGVIYHKARVQMVTIDETGEVIAMRMRTLCLKEQYPAGHYDVTFASLREDGQKFDFDFPVPLVARTASKSGTKVA